MRKPIVISLAVITLVIISTVFFFLWNFGFNTYNEAEHITIDGEHFLIYQGNKYYPTERQLFEIQSDKDDVIVSWHFNFPFTAVKTYYSYSKEHPAYIFCDDITNDVWIREDYNYQTDIFVIEETAVEILYENAFEASQIDIDYDLYYDDYITFIWHSKEHPKLHIHAKIFYKEDGWYMKLTLDKACQLSQDFVDLLTKNGIIE